MKTYSVKFDVKGQGPVEFEVSKITFDKVNEFCKKSLNWLVALSVERILFECLSKLFRIGTPRMDLAEILEIKSKTVALALVTRENPKPLAVIGSGFIADSKGYVVTAGHVITSLRELQLEATQAGVTTTLAAIRHTFDGENFHANYITFSDTYNVTARYDHDPENSVKKAGGVTPEIKKKYKLWVNLVIV